MAKIEILIPLILRWEGGFVNDPDDAGGATNKGVTIGTFREYRQRYGLPRPTVQDLRNISTKEWGDILKKMYWDRWKADEIQNQSIANMLVDWLWASGKYGIELPQKILGVDIDGFVGSKTIAALNGYPDQRELFDKIKAERVAYIDRIIKARPVNKKYRAGWLNRINSYNFSV